MVRASIPSSIRTGCWTGLLAVLGGADADDDDEEEEDGPASAAGGKARSAVGDAQAPASSNTHPTRSLLSRTLQCCHRPLGDGLELVDRDRPGQ